MATKTWDGADTSWHTDGNWSPSGIPGVGDDVVFDVGNAQACTLDGHAECDSVTNTDYAGTLDCDVYNLTVGGNFQFDSGSLDLGTGTITVAGNWDTSAVSFTRGTSTIVMSGASKTCQPTLGQNVHNLTVSGTVELITTSIGASNGTLNVTGTLTIDNGKYYRADNGHTITLGVSGTIQDDGGTGYLYLYLNTTGGIDTTDGIISCDVQCQHNCTLKARAFGADLRLKHTTTSTHTITVTSGALSIGGNLTLDMAGGSNSLVMDCAANDPAVNVDGYIDFIGAGGGTEVIQAGDDDWNVAGNIDLTGGTLTPAASEFILDGGGAQDVTSDTEAFYDLTVMQAADVVAFIDALNVTNVFKCATQNATLEFTDSVAYVLNTIDLAGAAANLITLQPSIGSNAYTWNVTTNTQCDYVDVSWCDATPGIDIVATNSNDGDNNTAWDFGVGDKDVPIGAALAATGAGQTPVPEVRIHPIVA